MRITVANLLTHLNEKTGPDALIAERDGICDYDIPSHLMIRYQQRLITHVREFTGDSVILFDMYGTAVIDSKIDQEIEIDVFQLTKDITITEERNTLLDTIISRWDGGDTCFELAEEWKDNEDVIRLLPELHEAMVDLDTAASKMAHILNKQ